MKKIIILFLLLSSFSFGQSLQIDSMFTRESSTMNKYIYTIDMKYPKFSFGPEALMGMNGVAGDMNITVDTVVQSWVKDFKSFFSEFQYDTVFNGMTSELSSGYNVAYLKNSYVSIEMTYYSFIAGSAHPNHFSYTFNYDYTNKGLLQFSDLFKADSGYEKFVSSYCYNALVKQQKKNGMEGGEDMVKEGTVFMADNYKNFTVSDKGITIIFNPYQAGPYAIGTQVVTIPKNKISKYIDTAGPLSLWWSN